MKHRVWESCFLSQAETEIHVDNIEEDSAFEDGIHVQKVGCEHSKVERHF